MNVRNPYGGLALTLRMLNDPATRRRLGFDPRKTSAENAGGEDIFARPVADTIRPTTSAREFGLLSGFSDWTAGRTENQNQPPAVGDLPSAAQGAVNYDFARGLGADGTGMTPEMAAHAARVTRAFPVLGDGQLIYKGGVPQATPELETLAACISDQVGNPFRMTSTTEKVSVHPAGTPHARGLAMDGTIRGERGDIMKAAEACGVTFAIDEMDNPKGAHYHFQAVPGRNNSRGMYVWTPNGLVKDRRRDP